MANISCSFLPLSCSTTGISILKTNLPIVIHPSSGLAGAFLGNGWTWRLFIADINGYLNQLNGDSSGTTGWGVATLQQGRVMNGSAIAMTIARSTTAGMNVFYVDDSSKLLTTAVYNISDDRNYGFQQTGRI